MCGDQKMASKLRNKRVKVTNENIYSFLFSTEINCLLILESKDGHESIFRIHISIFQGFSLAIYQHQ